MPTTAWLFEERILALLSGFNTINHQDCLAGLSELETGVVDLAFVDPPFNIGYDYDVFEDQRTSGD